MPDHEITTLLRTEFDAMRRYPGQSMNFRKKWISIKEAADYLGLSQSQIRNLINEDVLTAHRTKSLVLLNIMKINNGILPEHNIVKQRLLSQKQRKIRGVL